jgi:hypothetical protein
LVATTGSSERVTTGDLSDTTGESPDNAKFMRELDDVGTSVIATGTVALVLTAISFVLSFLYVCHGPRPGKIMPLPLPTLSYSTLRPKGINDDNGLP